MQDNADAFDTAFLAVSEKLKDRFLFIGKVSSSAKPGQFLFYLIEVLSPWFPSTRLESIIIGKLKNSFLNSPIYSDTIFEDDLRKINEALGALSNEGETDWIGNLNALIGYVDDNKVNLTLAGRIPTFLIRGGKVSNLSDSLISDAEPHPLKTFSNLTSGQISKDDKLVAANIRFYDSISVDRLRKFLEGKPVRAAMYDIYKNLRRLRTFDANALIISLIDEELPKLEKDLPEIFFLDRGEDSVLKKFWIKTKPYLNRGFSKAKVMAEVTYDYSKKTASKANENWKTKYAPKTKSFVQKGIKNVSDRRKTIHFEKEVKTSNNSQSRFKINSYRNDSYEPVEEIIARPAKASRINFSWFSKLGIIFKKENRRYLYIGLAIVLVVVFYLKIRANNNSKVSVSEEHDIIAAVDQAKTLLAQATNDIALGKTNAKDELISALALAQTGEKSPASHDEALAVERQIQDKLDTLIKATHFYDPKPIYSISGNVTAGGAIGETIYSVTDEGKIYGTDTRDKGPKLIASVSKDAGNVVKIATSSSANIAYLLTDKDRLFALDTTGNVVSEIKPETDGAIKPATAIAAYTTNFYLLDSSAGKVWKYSKTDAGYSKASSYADTKSVSITGAIDLTIDGNIYVLKSDASIAKFVRGTYSSDFSVHGIPTPTDKITAPGQIFTDSDSNFVYVLDKTNNRIVCFTKDGAYSNQYVFSGITISQFMVDPRVQKLWVTAGSNVYEISI